MGQNCKGSKTGSSKSDPGHSKARKKTSERVRHDHSPIGIDMIPKVERRLDCFEGQKHEILPRFYSGEKQKK